MLKNLIAGALIGTLLLVAFSTSLIPVLLLITISIIGIATYQYARIARVFLGELETGLVLNRQTNNFARFLPPGSHWIDPFSEKLVKKLPLNSQSVKFTSEGIQTSGGIPVKISWQASYAIKPDKIGRDHLVKMARAFSNKLDGMLQKRISAGFQHLVGDLTPQELTAQGAIKQLERRIKLICRAKLEDKGVKVNEVLIQNIQLPRHVRESLEAAHERELQADQEARILERLHGVISSFSDEEMDRLIELERIQLLGRNGVTMLYSPAGPKLDHSALIHKN